MNWSSEATAMLAAAPPFVRGLIRRKLEKSARHQGIATITAEFVNKARPHGPRQSPDPKETSDPAESAFARIGGNPITDAFPPDDTVHLFPEGITLDEAGARSAWETASGIPAPRARPRALYIHVPFCRARCSFCPFYANRWCEGSGRRYAGAVCAELGRLEGLPSASLPFDAVYFGGGTPSDLPPGDLRAILSALRRHVPLAPNAEITLEGRACGHSPELTEAAIEGGVNRFSVGIQTFDSALRRSLGRIESKENLLAFLDRLSATGAVVVADLIYGLPGQSPALWEEDLRILTRETRLSGADLYRLKLIPGSPIARKLGQTSPHENLRRSADFFLEGLHALRQAGWEQISVCHWRRDPRERSLYNTLAKSGAHCVPVGCGAGGRLGRIRFFHLGDLNPYFSAINAGTKPVASAIRLSDSAHAVDAIASDFDRSLLAPERWPLASESHRASIRRILGQWAEAGLVETMADGLWRLLPAGQFHAVTMGAKMAGTIQTAFP
jgi:anaerobilin synthase